MNEEQRERFEAWAKSQALNMARPSDVGRGSGVYDYVSVITETAWHAWVEATRQALAQTDVIQRTSYAPDDPGENWYRLKNGDILQPDDEFWCHNEWKKTGNIGDAVGSEPVDGVQYRRRKAMQ